MCAITYWYMLRLLIYNYITSSQAIIFRLDLTYVYILVTATENSNILFLSYTEQSRSEYFI